MHSASGSPSRSIRASSHCPREASLDDSRVFPSGMVDGGGLNHEKKYCWSSVGRIWQWNSNHWSARIERRVACVTLHPHLQMSSVVEGVFGPQGSSLGVSIEDLWTAMILKLSSRIIHWLLLLPVWMSRTFENTGFSAQHSQSCKNVQETIVCNLIGSCKANSNTTGHGQRLIQMIQVCKHSCLGQREISMLKLCFSSSMFASR